MTFCNEDPSLAIVGNIRPYVTSIVAMSEFQSWRMAHMFAHFDEMPSIEDRDVEILAQTKKHKEEFPTEHDRLPFLVDPYGFVRTCAEDVGADKWWEGMPLWKRLSLGWMIFVMSWTTSVYRLKNKDKRGEMEKHITHIYRDNATSRELSSSIESKLRSLLALIGLGIVLVVYHVLN